MEVGSNLRSTTQESILSRHENKIADDRCRRPVAGGVQPSGGDAGETED
jgi:hypothetical protein